jgi:hypothetical protein
MSRAAPLEDPARRIAVTRGGDPDDRMEAETEAPERSIATRS